MEFEVLTTERLLLKKFTPEGFKYLFENCSREDVKAQLGLATDEDYLKEKAKSDGGYTTYDRTIVQFRLAVKETGKVIGACGFHNWYPDHNKAELGYALTHEESKRKGYMSEAVDGVLAYGFSTMALNRVEACVGPGNAASLSLLKKNGFTKEGYLRKHYTRGGEVEDSIIFSLLREEYKGPQSDKTNTVDS